MKFPTFGALQYALTAPVSPSTVAVRSLRPFSLPPEGGSTNLKIFVDQSVNLSDSDSQKAEAKLPDEHNNMNYNTTLNRLARYRPLSLDSLKAQLLDELLVQYAIDGETEKVAQREANTAASIAWETPYPFLFLPELLEERIRPLAEPVPAYLAAEPESHSLALTA